ncbi:hypothetical protein EYF80_035826 [Liparis tanakae]|uniref:Uncharacterized protein n=1 Tax=Liparis tanakae TaxID=230148 RepID=A0A4Z2GK38_9TELE|nr:hypothetical protein EYF80_035826 [Liparis tanakae]
MRPTGGYSWPRDITAEPMSPESLFIYVWVRSLRPHSGHDLDANAALEHILYPRTCIIACADVIPLEGGISGAAM